MADEGPSRPALVTRHQGVRWTYADLLRRSEDLAVGLMGLGLEKGDRIGIWSANTREWVLAQFGTALAGLILVNINPAYRSHEFDYAIKKSGCRALILRPDTRTTTISLRSGRSRPRSTGRNRGSCGRKACRSSKPSFASGPRRRPAC